MDFVGAALHFYQLDELSIRLNLEEVHSKVILAKVASLVSV